MDYIPQGYEFWKDRKLDDTHRDWHYDGLNWVSDYLASTEHPHRKIIIETLPMFEPYRSLLEIGCNAGPNLAKIYGKKLAGIDANADAIAYAKDLLPKADLRVGNMLELPWPDKSFDVLLADAALMYISPEEIGRMMNEIDRVAKGVLIVDRFNESISGAVTGYVWGRNYPEILRRMGFEVSVKNITKDLWPGSLNWQLHGIVISARRS